ncbi:MAG TPA: FkbM family methyltransferase [Longimicrobium sp.]
MQPLRVLKRFAARLLPEPVKAAVRGRRYGYRPPAVSLGYSARFDASGQVRLEIHRLARLTLSRPAWEAFRFHLESNGESAEELYAFVQHAGAADGVLFDVGANHGIFTLAYCAARPGNRAIAFDAAAEPLADLRRALAQNGLADRAEIRQAWLSSASGTVHGSIDESGFFNTTREDRSREVVKTTIDAFVERTGIRPSIVKIDVDGEEIEVIAGAARTLREIRPTLFVELHHDLLEARGERPGRFVGLLVDAGYRFETLPGKPLAPRAITNTPAALLRFIARP